MLRERFYRTINEYIERYDFVEVTIKEGKSSVTWINRIRINEAMLELPENLWDSVIDLYMKNKRCKIC